MSGRAALGWRERLRRDLGWLLLAKLIGLVFLRVLFFSPDHRQHIDETAIADRLAVDEAPDGSVNDR